jgi:hypothetical protein
MTENVKIISHSAIKPVAFMKAKICLGAKLLKQRRATVRFRTGEAFFEGATRGYRRCYTVSGTAHREH